jgi:dipeptidyl aminopeptidase/acylaminoacyl peptidase
MTLLTTARIYALVCLLTPLWCQAQVKDIQAPLPIEAVAQANYLAATVDLSPDGEWVAYTIRDRTKQETSKDEIHEIFSRTGVPPVGMGCNVWISSTATNESRNLTDRQGNNWGPSWSPDGKYLAFYSDRNGKTQLWLWERSSGKFRLAASAVVHPFVAEETPQWTADSRSVLIKLLPVGMSLDDAARLTVHPKKQNSEEKRVTESTVTIYRSSPQKGNNNQSRPNSSIRANTEIAAFIGDLATIDITSGKVKLLARGYNPCWYRISPDGKTIAFVTAKGWADGNLFRNLYDLIIVPISGGNARVVAENIESLAILFETVSWSPDSKRLSYTDLREQGSKGDCYVVSINGGQPQKATQDPHPSFGGTFRAPLWDAEGQYVYLIAGNALWKISLATGAATELTRIQNKKLLEIVAPNIGGRFWSPDAGRSMTLITRDEVTKNMGFYKVDLQTGESTKLLEENKEYRVPAILFLDVSSERVVFAAQDAQHTDDLWLADAGFSSLKQLSKTNPQLDRYVLGTSRLIEWRTEDGQLLHGALLLPANYKEGTRYPLIVQVYGGAMLSDQVNRFGLGAFQVWTANMQLFATRGYAVLLPDSRLRVGTPMQDLAKTVLPGVDKVIEMGIADPNRLGVMGSSYGGYSTLALIVQTPRFKAAVMHAGYGDLIGDYGELSKEGVARSITLAENGINRMGGTPWQYRDRFIENSPFFYLDRVQTPLLITHGSRDTNVPVFLADQIFVGLRRLGKEVVYAKYEGEGHALLDYANQLDYLNRVFAWFDEHVASPKTEK